MSPSPPRGPAAVLLAVACLAPSARGQTDDRTAESADGVLAPDRYGFRGTDGEADAVDARFPQDPERVRQLKAAARAVRAGEWVRAGEALLFILGGADGELVRLADGSSASVTGEAGRLLERFPARERRELGRRLGPAARQALDRAVAAGDAAGLRAVAVQFPATAAARAARDRLAALHLDRGEPGPAARLFAASLADPDADPAVLEAPRWRARAAAAFARSGDPERARELWAAVAPADRAALGLGEEDAATGLPAALVDSAGSDGSPPVDAAEPLLVPRWTVPVVGDPAARADLAERVDRAERGGAILLPAARPLVITPPGAPTLALARTTDGAVAVDAATGAVRWRTRPAGGAASLNDPFTDDSYADDADEEAERVYDRFYRDAAFGTLTTDGTRAFLLEADPAEEESRGYGPSDAEVVRLAAYRLDGGRLAWEVGGERRDEPFDLPLAGWRPLAPPTHDAGDLFLVAERLAGDDRGRVALFCLDPATGLPRWDRTVAFSDAALDRDAYRAEWGAFPAVAGGVVVVPTTIGWVAGVDRLTREVLWVSRVADAEQRRSGRGWIGARRLGGVPASAARERELPDYWFPGPPLVEAGPGRGRVFHTPPGGDRLYALDLLTGEPLWRPRRRQTWKAAAGLLPARSFPAENGAGESGEEDGATGGAVLLVGPRAVAAVAADDGSRRLWTWTVRAGDGRPSGLPRVAGDRVLVPLSGGVLVTLDAGTGAELGRARRSDAGGRLGNLAAAGGRLLSLSPDGLTGFEDRAALAADLLAAAGGPPDPALALREAELLRTAGDPAAVLAKLDAALAASPGSGPAPAGLSADDAAQFAALLRAALRDLILDAGSGPPPPDRQDALLARLATAAATDPDRIAAARLRADRLAARGDGAAAVAVLRDLMDGRLTGAAIEDDPLVPAATAGGPPPPAADPAGPAPDAEVRLSRWVSRTLRTMHEAGGDGRRAVDAFADDLLAGADGLAAPGSPAAELLPFHPTVATARLAWAEPRLTGDGQDAAAAEFVLSRLAVERGSDGKASAVAETAAARLRSLEESSGESPGDSSGVPGSYTLAVEALASDDQVRPPAPLPTPAAVRPFYRSHLLVPAADGTRLDLLGPPAANGRRPAVARFPLRGAVAAADPGDRARLLQILGRAAAARMRRDSNPFRPNRSGRRPAVGWVGGTAFVVANGAVTALHPETGATLWARTVDGAAPAGGEAAFGVPVTGAGGSARLAQVEGLARAANRTRPRSGVAAANEEVVLVLDDGDRTLTALDSRTGRTVWVRRRLAAAESAVLATASAVLLTPTSGRAGALALAARDGVPLPGPDREADAGAETGADTPLGGSAGAFAVAGAGVVRIAEQERLLPFGGWLGGGGPGYEVQCWDPATGATLWQRGVDGDAKLAVLPGVGPPVAVEVGPDGRDADAEAEGSLRDLRTGARTRLGGVDAGGAAVAVVADAERVALAAVRPGPVNRYASRETDGVAVAGTVDLFARTGGRLWRAAAGGAVLLEDGFDRLPFVTLLTADRADERGELAEAEIAAFDKRTGREVFRSVIPAVSPAYDAAAELDGRALRLWNDGDESWRLSVVPAPEPGAAGEPDAAAAPDAAPAGEGEAGGEVP